LGKLVAVEVRRLASRRLLRILLLLTVTGVSIAAVVLLARSTGEPRRFDNVVASDPRFHLRNLITVFGGITAPLVIGGWLLGAASIGAEWHAGTMATTLTWEPRRVRLLVAKALAAVLVTIALFVAVQVFLAITFLPAALVGGTTEGIDRAWFAEAAALLARGAAMTGMGAVIGFSIAAVARNTGAALGAGFAYLVIFENILGALFPGWRSWMLVPNAIVFVANFRGDQLALSGRTMLSSGLILGCYATAMLALAAAWFRQRDVT
jgi:ABC-type transport system involved in multi-copper enzyme maturation permease subunit